MITLKLSQELLDNFAYIFSSNILLVALMFPWVRYIFPSLTGYNKRLHILKNLRTFIYSEIEEHERVLDEDNPKDYIDVFLIEKKKTDNSDFDADQLMMTILDMFGAASDTTSSTLCWAVLFLSLHEDLQEQCHREILRHTEGREVRLEDSEDLNLCQAFMAEVQRHGQVALTSVMHRVSKEVGRDQSLDIRQSVAQSYYLISLRNYFCLHLSTGPAPIGAHSPGGLPCPDQPQEVPH